MIDYLEVLSVCCMLQAIVRGALRQQTAFSLVLLAIERCIA